MTKGGKGFTNPAAPALTTPTPEPPTLTSGESGSGFDFLQSLT